MLPNIVQPTKQEHNFKTLTDKIDSNVVLQMQNQVISRSCYMSVFHYFYCFWQFLKIVWSKFVKENFILDYTSIDSKYLIKAVTGIVNRSFVSFFDKD